MTKKLLVANWKANPDSPGRALVLAKKIEKATPKSKVVEVVIAPPFPFLLPVAKVLKKAKLGAQDVFWEDIGPYTSEISWHQLKHLKVAYVIVGHSERRRLLRETDDIVNKKVLAALKAGLKVILCVGEPKAIRKKGIGAAKNYVKSQLQKDLRGLKPKTKKLVIAYEPIWAIGTGAPDKPEDTVKMAQFIKTSLNTKFKILNTRILYGGSVTGKNAAAFLKHGGIGGALVGGASLKPKEFGKIITIASKIK